jgi:holo-[acyl-carrier protein] synthase
LSGWVLGLGVDIVETARIRDSLARFGDRFKRRVFTDGEQAYCDGMADPAMHYAGRFAAKEAVSKTFGTGIGNDLGWRDIEVHRNERGAPSVELRDKGLVLLRARGATAVLISLAHTKDHAVAQAILVSSPPHSEIGNRKSEIPLSS